MKILAFLFAMLVFQQASADTGHSWDVSVFPDPARIITGSGVRVRATPSLNGKEIAKLSVGTITHELQRTDALMKVGDMQDYWYLIKLANGQQGWVFGAFSMPVEKQNIESAYLEIAKQQFQRRQDNFNDLVDLSNFLKKISQETRQTDSSAVFSLLHLLTLQAVVRLLPDEVSNNRIYHRWTTENAAYLFQIPLGDGGWMVNSEVFWRLHTDYPFSVVADDIAWQAAENGVFSDCEGELSCYFEVINETYGKYLSMYPDGQYAQAALDKISEYLEWMERHGDNTYTEHDGMGEQVTLLRQAIDGTHVVAKNRVLNQLVHVLQTADSTHSSSDAHGSNRPDIQEQVMNYLKEEGAEIAFEVGKEILQNIVLRKLGKRR